MGRAITIGGGAGVAPSRFARRGGGGSRGNLSADTAAAVQVGWALGEAGLGWAMLVVMGGRGCWSGAGWAAAGWVLVHCEGHVLALPAGVLGCMLQGPGCARACLGTDMLRCAMPRCAVLRFAGQPGERADGAGDATLGLSTQPLLSAGLGRGRRRRGASSGRGGRRGRRWRRRCSGVPGADRSQLPAAPGGGPGGGRGRRGGRRALGGRGQQLGGREQRGAAARRVPRAAGCAWPVGAPSAPLSARSRAQHLLSAPAEQNVFWDSMSIPSLPVPPTFTPTTPLPFTFSPLYAHTTKRFHAPPRPAPARSGMSKAAKKKAKAQRSMAQMLATGGGRAGPVRVVNVGSGSAARWGGGGVDRWVGGGVDK